jgi:putative ABC transport system permease protein
MAAEVATALLLLTGAGLLLRSYARVVQTDLGFTADRRIVVDIELPPADYPDPAARARVLDGIVARARTLPGVTAAALADTLPLHRVTLTPFEVAGQPPRPRGEVVTADAANMSPGFLEILGTPVIRGRTITPADVGRNRGGGPGVVLVNQAFVEKYLPSGDPLRQQLILDGRPYEIVGIAANFRALGAEADVRPQFFRAGADGDASVLLLQSGSGASDALTRGLRGMLGAIDEQLSTSTIEPMDALVDSWLETRWFGLVLVSVFAALALLLAMIGVHSVLANLVAARTREIGIRMALGSTPAGIGRLIAGQTVPPVAAGVAVGLAGSLALGRVIQSMLFQVAPYDPLTLSLAAAAVAIATPLAIWWPVRRATRVECTVALRDE